MDFKNALSHIIGENELKSLRLNMLADSGACMMTINKTIQLQLLLLFIEKRKVLMAIAVCMKAVNFFETGDYLYRCPSILKESFYKKNAGKA